LVKSDLYHSDTQGHEMGESLTVIIPCKNEQANIRACIESAAAVADELIVADSGSTDRTLAIVNQFGSCRVIEREYITSGDFKNWAIPQASCPWVLVLDADERVTPKLADEIKATLKKPEFDGYRIYRDNHFMGHRARSCGWNNDWVLRLFRRDMGRYEGPSDHGRVKISSGNVSQLNSRLLHYTYWNYDQYFRKLDRYSTTAAREWFEDGKPSPSIWKMLFRAKWKFFRNFILQGGFREGRIGFQIAVTAAFYSFMKQARLWELHHARKPFEIDARQPSNEL
jgi:(heptosyl)LPS beta-1,4-glucosyltransferase